jgi:hypothetical protein
MAPVVGVLKSGKEVIKAWGKVAKDEYDLYKHQTRHPAIIRPGDAMAAFNAVTTLMERGRDNHLALALVQTADLGARGALALLDGGAVSGPLIAAATALHRLAQRIKQFATEYKESKAANKLLEDPDNLDFKLFEKMPLLGAYMICCTEPLDIVLLSQVEFGAEDWLDDIQETKEQHIDPLRARADGFIRKSPFEIKGLSSLAYRGAMSHAKRVAAGY